MFSETYIQRHQRAGWLFHCASMEQNTKMLPLLKKHLKVGELVPHSFYLSLGSLAFLLIFVLICDRLCLRTF